MDWEAEYIRSNETSSSRRDDINRGESDRRDVDSDNNNNNNNNDNGGGGGGGGGGSSRRRIELLLPPPTEKPADTPLDRLTRHWMNERHAPDILPAQENLLAHLLDHLRRQSDAIQLLRGDPSASEEEHIRIILVQTEIERVKFLVRSYVRTRLYKIERYARLIATDPDTQTRLTAAERDHALRYAKLTDQHYYSTVLQGLPENQAHLDETPLFVPPMITVPDKGRPVFVHALQRCPRLPLPDGATLEMDKGHISLLPYSIVEDLVARGEVELI